MATALGLWPMSGASPARTDRTDRTDRTAGLSVLELVVALAIFAIAALTGAEVLTSAVSVDRQMAVRHQQTEKIALTLTLARRDLRNAVSLRPDRSGDALVDVRLTGAGMARESDTLTTGMSEIAWEWSPADQTLRRGIAGPGGQMRFATLLSGVEAFDLGIVDEGEHSRLIRLSLTVAGYGDLSVTEVTP